MAVRAQPSAATEKSGLAYWMSQTLKEADNAARDFSPDPVHDLRVAIRRCRSMAEVIQNVDPNPAWKKFRKAGKRLFSSLGELRDRQVLMEWIERLSTADDPVRQRLLEQCKAKEQELKKASALALQDFDAAQWQKWIGSLSQRISHFRPDSELFAGIALERWERARQLHKAALRSRSKVALHRLRIGIKKFRYVVENFLPTLHQQVGKSLKEVQDLLGEIHDLDVLWATALQENALANAEDRNRWHQLIHAARKQREDTYRKRAMGPDNVWQQWREKLPDGEQAERATFRRIETWAGLLDPDPARSKRIARESLRIHGLLVKTGAISPHGKSRQLLKAAAIMQDVGRRKQQPDHHKRSRKLISNIELPFGWTEQDRQVAALVARYHRGALPHAAQKTFAALPENEQRTVISLAAVLRLANACDDATKGAPGQIKLQKVQGYLVLSVNNLARNSREAEHVAAARYLLELACGMPILIDSPPG